MKKYDVLLGIFYRDGFFEKQPQITSISISDLLEVISRDKYNLSKDLGISSYYVTKYMKILCPDRPQTTVKLDAYLLAKYGYKECKNCLNTYTLNTDFHKNTSKKDGYNTYCKTCQNKLTAVTSPKRQAKYNAAKLNRIVSWTDMESISKFYANCPEGYHVDHIIPLQGEYVSGLHVLNNLQYLAAVDNLSKSNKFEPL